MGPELSFIRLTTKCNAQCEMCSVWRREPVSFKKDRLFSILKELKSNGVSKILLTGGEPTLYENFLDLNKFLEKENIDFGLISNGSVIYKKWKSLFLYRKPSYIIFSLDSVSGDYHDKNRKIKNLTRNVMNSIRKALEENVIVSINTVLTRNNYLFLEDFLKFDFMSKISEWHWIPVKFSPKISLRAKDWKALKGIYQKIKRKKVISNLVTTFNFIENVKYSNLEKGELTSSYYAYHDCKISQKLLFIEVNGDVFRCNSFDIGSANNICLGNINDQGINIIISKLMKNILLETPKCKNCDPRNQMFNKDGHIYENWIS
jgi:radical SAM protein with 4Fe4S-binding SPASM domain